MLAKRKKKKKKRAPRAGNNPDEEDTTQNVDKKDFEQYKQAMVKAKDSAQGQREQAVPGRQPSRPKGAAKARCKQM